MRYRKNLNQAFSVSYYRWFSFFPLDFGPLLDWAAVCELDYSSFIRSFHAEQLGFICHRALSLFHSLSLVSFSVSPLWRNLFAHSFIYIYFSWMLQCYAMNFHIIIKLGLMIHMIHIETVQFNVIFSSQLGFCVAAAFFPRLLLR